MKIAVPTNDGTTVSRHFGRSAAFQVFEVQNGKITGREMRRNDAQHKHEQGDCGHHHQDSGPHSHAGIVSILAGCEIVICGGMGWRAAEALQSAGIVPVVGPVEGSAEGAVMAYLNGELAADPDAICRCGH